METTKAVIKKIGEYSLNGGYRIDGSVTKFWAKKSEAVAYAKSIKWPVSSVVRCYTRFQMGYALSWGIAREGALLSKAGIESTPELQPWK